LTQKALTVNMPHMRIVSFLPAATEMIYLLGLGDDLVGRS